MRSLPFTSSTPRSLLLPAALLSGLVAGPVQAAFHQMEIEQVIGGVNGDTTAQAIQLQMKGPGQTFVSVARVKAYDAAGANPIILIDMTTDVANTNPILITTANFANYTTPTLVSDFTMTNPIPVSYLAAGRITFEDDFGTIYWSLSFGGSGYAGSNLGSTTNDLDGNFGPPFDGPCPSTTLQALKFKFPATQLSSNNKADYDLTAGAAVLTNNHGNTFTVGVPATTLTQWRSHRLHNGTDRSIVLNATATGNGSGGPTVEPRSGGIQTIQVDFSTSVTLTGTPANGITVGDGTTSYSATSVVAVDANTIAINFDPGVLPDQKCYTISIGPGTVTQTLGGDLDCKVRSLVGDTSGNGLVNLSDALLTLFKATSSVSSAAEPAQDVNLSGGNIDLADALFIKALATSPAHQASCP